MDPGISVVFTDLSMPNLDGFGLLERVRTASNPRIREMPVIKDQAYGVLGEFGRIIGEQGGGLVRWRSRLAGVVSSGAAAHR